MTPWVLAQLSLDHLNEARPAVARLRAMGFSTRDFDALCKAKEN